MYSFLLYCHHGNMCGVFKGKKGLRQGDSLSQFLFVICLKYFFRALKKATKGSDFNFHPKCSKLRITHLALVDYLVLFARGDVLFIHIIMNYFRDFGAKFSLQANVLKSSIFIASIKG